MQRVSEIAEEITLDWNMARMLLLILQKKKKRKPSRKIKKCYKEFLQDCNLHFIVSDLEGRICNSPVFPLHTMGRASLLARG